MAILLTAHQITKTFGEKPLFRNLDLVIESGDRIGLIGPNGAGKSTLLRLLTSEISPDEGDISFASGLRVAYVEQTPQLDLTATIEEVVLGLNEDADGDQIARAQEAMAHLSLNSSTIPASTPIKNLSGGWKKRVALARALARDPDVLLLDEPTNHLDVESILWLESLLERARFATLTITHDRLFLQRISNRIVELNRRHANGLLNVKGDYTEYLKLNEAVLSAQQSSETKLKNTLRRETEWLSRGPKARTTKQQARIDRAADLKDEVGDLQYRNQSKVASLEFQGSGRSPQKLIEAKGISKKYGDRTIFENIDLLITPETRLGILGVNGCGKSTLLKILLGNEKPDTGTVFCSEQLKVAYFEQSRDELDPSLTVLRTVCPHGDSVIFGGRAVHVRGYLDRFLFRTEQHEMKVGKLSGGEQSRLMIAKLMLQPANVLVLDEPTNDLDMATLDVLMDTLNEFKGAVLLVTHDRYFLDQVARQILSFDPRPDHAGELTTFTGLEQWETWRATISMNAPKKSATKNNDASSEPTKKRKMSYKEVRELETIQPEILKVESRISELHEQSQATENTSDAKKLSDIYAELGKLQPEIERLYERWAELEKIKEGA